MHRYSAGPAYASREVAVALGAFDVAVCDCETGEVAAAYEREWGEAGLATPIWTIPGGTAPPP